MTTTKFVHIHIPKTAGGSVLQIIRMNFPHAILEDVWLPIESQIIGAEQVRMLLDLHPGRRAYSSHRITLDLPFDHADGLVAIIFVRDPVQHTVSSFYYARAMQLDAHLPMAKQMSLDKFVEHFLERGESPDTATYLTMSLGKQAQFIFGSQKPVDLAYLDSLIAKGKVLLFPSDRFDECCVALESLYPLEFKDCAYSAPGNVTAGERPPLDAALRTRIEAATTQDRTLYDRACTFLDTALAKAYPDQQERDQALTSFAERRRIAASRPAEWLNTLPIDVKLFLGARRYFGRGLRSIARMIRA